MESGRPVDDEDSSLPAVERGVFSSFLMSYGAARRRSGGSPIPNGSSHGPTTSSHQPSDDDRLSRYSEVTSYLRLKRLFSNVDLLSAVYRSILPLPVWICYFANGPGADYIPTYYLSVKLLNLFFLLRAIVVAAGNTLAGRTVGSLVFPFSLHHFFPDRSTEDTLLSKKSKDWIPGCARFASTILFNQ